MATSKPVQGVAQDAALDDLGELLKDWRRHLRATNTAPRTITSYLNVGEEFVAFLTERGMPTSANAITREHVEHYIVHLQERPNQRTGKPLSPATVAKQYRSLQQLFRWLHEVEEEIASSPFARMQAPQVPEQPVPLIPDDAMKALLAACKGTSFEERRDTAYIRLLVDSGPRAGEITPLTLDDLDFEADVAQVMGKGRRARAIPFGNKTADALRRYIRARARHPKAGNTDRLWIGSQGPMTESGLAQVLKRRGKQAEIGHVYPHLMRHLFSHNFLAAGGREQDLMRLNGWRSREMVARYGASAADERAREAYHQAAVGDAKY